MAGPLYLSVVEFIKRRPFDVFVPAYYHPNIPDDMKNAKPTPLEKVNRFKMVPTKRRNPLPFYQVADPHRLQRASYTIEIMLDMFQRKVEFELANEEDVVEILEGIDRYLVSLEHDIRAGSELVITYCRLLVQWRDEVYKHYYRYMMTHPTSLASLYPNNDRHKNIYALLSMLNGTSKEVLDLDPLRAKARPPFEIAAIAPKDTSQDKVDQDQNDSGLDKNNRLIDDGREFKLDDFLKKG